ncbi:MAG: hypothetical protein ABIS18_11070, partial [Actinomycetota bacterium]
MAKDKESVIETLEAKADEGLAQGPDGGNEFAEEPLEEESIPLKRLAMVAVMPTLAAAVMAGGVFIGFSPRIWASVAGMLGVGIAVLAYRMRKPVSMNIAIIVGLFAVGILLTIPAGDLNDVFG